jgi:hypothetical protein
VLLRGVTLQGAGAGRTTISSSAADAGLLVLTGDRVSIRDLSVRRTGTAVGSVLVAGSEASVELSRIHVSGARVGRDGGGAGVLMTSAEGEKPREGTTLEVTDARLSDNDAAGIVMTGSHRASIRGTQVRRSGQCGVCFLGSGGGAVRDSGFVGNGVAVAVAADAAPLVADNRISGGQVGVQATDRSAPVLRDNVVSGADRAAVIYSGRATGRADRTRCRDVRYGLVVGPSAAPYLGDNDCPVARGR